MYTALLVHISSQFTLYMMFNLNVQENNDDVQAYLTKLTLVMHNTCTYAAFHKAV